MISSVSAVNFFLKLKPGWLAIDLDAIGLSGGTLLTWNPCMANLRAYNSCAGIMVEGFFKGFPHQICIFNVYGPYSHRVDFWDWIKASGILSDDYTIVAGDLNFTISARDIWGHGRSVDPLADYFIRYFENENLTDVKPAILSPTWSNKRTGPKGLAKRLDRFFVSDRFCHEVHRYRSWTQPVGFSDHCAILLQFDFEGVFCPYPFKFNAAWLDDPLFCDFVRQFWNNLPPRGPGSILKCFWQRLSLLQKEVWRWDIKMKRSRHSALVYLENKIDTLSALMDVDYFSVER